MDGFKCFDKIFYYPATMPDQVIESDLFRSFLKSHFDYDTVRQRTDVVFVFPTSVKKVYTHALLEKHADKKIVFVYWGENIFGYFRLVSQVHAVLRKLNLSSSFIDALLFNPIMRLLLGLKSPMQTDTYFKDIVKQAAPNHYFILTNKLKNASPRVFFAPYFYYFNQGHVKKILSKPVMTTAAPRKFCAFIVSNPNNLDRIDFFKKLSRYKTVDSFGKVLNNKSLNDLNKDHIIADYQSNDLVYQQYKFVVCFENSYAEGYVTEKIINAIAGGAIPLYRGAPDVATYFNAARVVNYDACGSYDSMVNAIIALDQDEERYRQFVNQPVFNQDIAQDLTVHNNQLAGFLGNLLHA